MLRSCVRAHDASIGKAWGWSRAWVLRSCVRAQDASIGKAWGWTRARVLRSSVRARGASVGKAGGWMHARVLRTCVRARGAFIGETGGRTRSNSQSCTAAPGCFSSCIGTVGVAAACKVAGFAAAECRAVGHTVLDCHAVGFTAGECRAAGFSAAEARGACFIVTQVQDITNDVLECEAETKSQAEELKALVTAKKTTKEATGIELKKESFLQASKRSSRTDVSATRVSRGPAHSFCLAALQWIVPHQQVLRHANACKARTTWLCAMRPGSPRRRGVMICDLPGDPGDLVGRGDGCPLGLPGPVGSARVLALGLTLEPHGIIVHSHVLQAMRVK